MLNKKRTAGWARLRLLLALPLTGAMLCTSTMAFTKDYGYVDLLPEKSDFTTPAQDNAKVENTKRNSQQQVENIKKRNQVKPDKTYKPQMQDRYVVYFKTDSKTGKPVRQDKRFIVINGKPFTNQAKFYGAWDLTSAMILSREDATKKYGSNGLNGAVELTGTNISYYDEIVPPPPPPKIDVVKFPPPIVRSDQNYFTPVLKTDKISGVRTGIDARYIIINGAPIADNSKFLGVTKTETIIYLSPTQAMKVYGEEKGKYGAVQIMGSNIYFNKQGDQIKPPPTVAFPPPIVRPDKPRRISKTPPPPVEPPPPGYRSKRQPIKFPPPIVKPDKLTKTSKDDIMFPPPIVKFPPPIIKKDKKTAILNRTKAKMTEGDPMMKVNIVTTPKLKEEVEELVIKLVDSTKKKTNN